jgi:tellurite resistance protein
MAIREDEKRAAQMAFLTTDNSLTTANESVNRFYEQLLTRGEIQQTIGKETITDQVINEHSRDVAQQLDMEQDKEQGIEPER